MQYGARWVNRTLETVILPAMTPVADVRAAGSARCDCGHTVLMHASAPGACRSCECGRFELAATTAS